MRAVVQRVSRAEVRVEGTATGSIAAGLCVLLAVGPSDRPETARHLADRIATLRVFADAAAKMKPLPKDEQDPLRDGATLDHLVLWLAYKEAKAMTGFDPPPAPATADGK